MLIHTLSTSLPLYLSISLTFICSIVWCTCTCVWFKHRQVFRSFALGCWCRFHRDGPRYINSPLVWFGMISFRARFFHFIHIMSTFNPVLFHCQLLIELTASSPQSQTLLTIILRFITNKFMREQITHSVDQSVEWAYAFDVHCNAFFPLLLILHGLQLFLIKGVHS